MSGRSSQHVALRLDLGLRGPRVVLVGVDDSVTAQRAASYAAGVAAQSSALLIVVHARPVPVQAWSGICAIYVPEDENAYKMAVFTPFLRMLQEGSAQFETELGMGDPVRYLLRVARARQADLVVVGSSHSLRHKVCGSVSSRLLAHSQWPVVVVP